MTNNKESIETYRNVLGNTYKEHTDEEVLSIVGSIKGFCHSIINKHIKEFSGIDSDILSNNHNRDDKK